MANSNKLIGHEEALELFYLSFKQKRLCSTYLFAGQAGIGKRLCARECAKLILCQQPVKTGACQQCKSCHSFQEHTSPFFSERYFKEEQSKSESAVDVVRVFIEEIDQVSSQQRMVYLIPNLQDYSIQVQNALLKTLEEPPANITIILTSDHPERILETITSRSQMIRFYPLPHHHLVNILKQHNQDIEKIQPYLDVCEGRVDLALKFSQEQYQMIIEWTHKLVQNLSSDFLSIATEAKILSDQLNPDEQDSSDRSKIIEFISIFEKSLFNILLQKIRTHFVAMQLFNTTVHELIRAKHSIETSGHVLLSLEHYFQIISSRLIQMLRYSKMEEVQAIEEHH